MVTAWGGPRRAQVTGPQGLLEVDARAVVLATGARERPRAARLVPGTRPSGIFTTGQLQQWVHRQRLPLSGRALIVGAEHVSYSAVLTLRAAGVRPVALVTDLAHTQTFRSFDLATRVGLHVPVWTRTAITGVAGRDRVDGVLVRGPDDIERTVAVDVVVFTGDFIPDNELARLAHLTMDPGTKGPACDVDGATSAPGVFATGNLVHPAETADVAAHRASGGGSRRRRVAAQRRPQPGRARGGPPARRGPPPLGCPEPGRARPGRDRAPARQEPGLSGTPAARRDPGWPAPRFVPPPSHDPEPVPRRVVRLAAARAAWRGRPALGVVTRAGGREKAAPREVPLTRRSTDSRRRGSEA